MADKAETETEARCEYCGAEPGPDWLSLDTFRDNGGEGPDLRLDILSFGFCSTDHAGRYLMEGKLPPADFSQCEPLPRTWRDRLLDWSVLALFLSLGVLALIGIWAIVQWLRT